MEILSESHHQANGDGSETFPSDANPTAMADVQPEEGFDQSQRLQSLAAEVRDQDELERSINFQAGYFYPSPL